LGLMVNVGICRIKGFGAPPYKSLLGQCCEILR